MHQVSPEMFRKILPELKGNELKLLTVLYETEEYVPDSRLQSEMGLNSRQLGSVLGWFKNRIHREGGSMPYRSDCFLSHEANGECHYCLIDHLRSVVGEFLMRKQIGEMEKQISLMKRQINKIQEKIGG